MIQHTQIRPRFVKGIPQVLEPGVIYVSMEYGTVVHSCCCGCGHEVVTPLTPTDWHLTVDGDKISLWPSVGNWNLPCRSHYVIKGNRVIEAGPWGKARIEAGQKRDKAAKAKFYAHAESPPLVQGNRPEPPADVPTRGVQEGLWTKLWRWFG